MHCSNTLQIDLRAALMARQATQVRALLATHGLPAFARAISRCSARVAADALSLLCPDDRQAVLRHLPHPVCDSLRPLGIALVVAQRGAPLVASTAQCQPLRTDARLRVDA
ncbi:hypothetical protein [Comamonas sp. 17RB]|uniref:hypothetical protein n=1 Tax=Comamonas sp. 17RB TaxID=3047025 RepID=UPI0024B68D5F|nr:hypothetical protein [Comamonas sp. 17RB]MDI9856741.1 hypothetical protein [Comamonas sp. 17RB]